ncbi:MAG TPA: hypothetical protein VGR47_15945 [Terracidiphilus sp.]|nr:hypothetical protein [Terracidiphilus sp.]
MAIDSVIAQIDAEIARLHEVRSLLAGTGKASAPAHNGRAKKASARTGTTRRKRVLSPEARKRIADAQRKRWAAQKARSK